MTGEDVLAARRIALRFGHLVVPPAEAGPGRILDTVEAYNAGARLEGQPDALNPAVLDPARVRAFVDGLPRVPDDVLRRLEGRALFLSGEGTRLAASSPIEADAIGAGYSLSLSGGRDAVAQAKLRAPVRRAYAADLAARAEEAMGVADREVDALEASYAAEGDGTERGRILGALTQAKRRRFASAKVWSAAADAVAELAPEGRDAAQRARDAVSRFVVPSWMGVAPG